MFQACEDWSYSLQSIYLIVWSNGLRLVWTELVSTAADCGHERRVGFNRHRPISGGASPPGCKSDSFDAAASRSVGTHVHPTFPRPHPRSKNRCNYDHHNRPRGNVCRVHNLALEQLLLWHACWFFQKTSRLAQRHRSVSFPSDSS